MDKKSSGKGSSLFRSPPPVVFGCSTLKRDDNDVVDASLRDAVLKPITSKAGGIRYKDTCLKFRLIVGTVLTTSERLWSYFPCRCANRTARGCCVCVYLRKSVGYLLKPPNYPVASNFGSHFSLPPVAASARDFLARKKKKDARAIHMYK